MPGHSGSGVPVDEVCKKRNRSKKDFLDEELKNVKEKNGCKNMEKYTVIKNK